MPCLFIFFYKYVSFSFQLVLWCFITSFIIPVSFLLHLASVKILLNLVLYRKAQKKSSAMNALTGFALGGEAMKKQINEERRKRQEHVVTVDKSDTDKGKDSQPSWNIPYLHKMFGHTLLHKDSQDSLSE